MKHFIIVIKLVLAGVSRANCLDVTCKNLPIKVCEETVPSGFEITGGLSLTVYYIVKWLFDYPGDLLYK